MGILFETVTLGLITYYEFICSFSFSPLSEYSIQKHTIFVDLVAFSAEL